MTSVRPTCLIDIIERPGRTICKISGTYNVNDLWPNVVKLTCMRMSRHYRQKKNKNLHTPKSFWLSKKKKKMPFCVEKLNVAGIYLVYYYSLSLPSPKTTIVCIHKKNIRWRP